MRGLKICLWVAGVLFLLGAAGIFLPDPAWVSIVEFFGGESSDLAYSPLSEYLLRVALAMSFLMGVYLVVLALQPMKYPVLIPFTGLALLFLGLACGVSGVLAAMPVLWFMGDSLSCLVLGVLILLFWQKAKVDRTGKEN